MERQRKFWEAYPKQSLTRVQFDEMETHEHTKLKPLSIAIAVCARSRKILHFEVSSMPAKGPLAEKSRKKYGFRWDGRPYAMKTLFHQITPLLAPRAELMSDQNPKYPAWLRTACPKNNWVHTSVKGLRGCIVGQGELKASDNDPLFSLNHTCAMIRANLNRLFRRTWCTTKTLDGLRLHLAMYVDFHNRFITETLKS